MENSVLALQFFCMVLIGEFDVQVFLLAQLHTDHLFFESGNELMASDGQGLALCGAACEGNAVHGTSIVQVDRITFLHGTVFHVNRAAGLFAVFLNAGVYHFVRQLLQIGFNGQSLIISQRYVRSDEHFQMELQVLAGANLVQVNLGLINGLQIIFFNSRTVRIREDDLESVIIENALAVKGLDHFARSLALPETRNVDTLTHLKESLRHCFIKLLRGDRKGQFRFVSGQLLVGMAHEYLSS